jgi:poly(3-hydroxybutyrate) depolymerase
VAPSAITKTAVLAIEGGQDDITGKDQTRAALELLTGLPIAKQNCHIEEGAGHYGSFTGRGFRRNIEPKIRQFIRTHS